jgi:type I restriction enzyme S subunit
MNVFSNPISKQNLTEPIEIDEKQNEVQFGDVFFTTSSETPEEVGMTSVWMNKEKNIYLNSFCFAYRPEKVFDNYYLAYMLRSSSIRKKIVFLAQGISRYNISKNKVMEIYVPIPHIEEQIKIGSYFQKLDKQIDLQQKELEKLKNIKKASLAKMFI